MRLLYESGGIAIGVFVSFIISLYASSFPFFWDTIQLGSEHANWFYTNGFSSLLVPDYLDSGHFPLFGIYLALLWIFLGKSLMVSHFAMLPCLALTVYYLFRIGSFLTDSRYGNYFLLLLFCNPYFLGQSVLVSPDIVLLAFLLISLDAYLRSNNWQLVIGAIGLSVISQRGLMIILVLGVWIFANNYLKKDSPNLKSIKYILPGVLLAGVYQLFHYLSKGWIGYHTGSPWAASFENVSSLYLLLKNVGVFIWRLGDLGNFAIWIGLIAITARGRMRDSKILIFLGLLVLGFAVIIIPKVGLLNHRYFLPIVVVGMIALLELIYKSTIRFKPQLVIGLGVLLLSGNFWSYPEGVAQGWDSTLAHLPYYELFDNAVSYMELNDIDIEEVGSGFPAKNNKVSDIYLNDNDKVFKPFDLDKDNYILYSNVMNEFQSEHLFELDNLWNPIFKKEKGTINIILFKRR